jgi:hypothetical protein
LSLRADPDKPDEIILSVVLSELYSDLVAAIGHYIEDLRHTPDMARRASERLERSLRAVSQADLLRRCRRYLRESDFDYVLAEVDAH